MRLPRFQFSLRTLFVVVTGLSVLLSQWPLVEWAPAYTGWGPPRFVHGLRLFRGEQGADIFDDVPAYYIPGWYVAPTRVLVVGSFEGALLIGWIGWRLVRRRRKGRKKF